MINNLRIKNFKAWKDTGGIRFAPLTVLFGSNSAGKTSIPQLLLMLKQTAESSDRSRPVHLGDARSLVELGTYADVTHQHKTAEPVEFAVEWTLPEPLNFTDPVSEVVRSVSSLKLDVKLATDKKGQPAIMSMQYELQGDASTMTVLMSRRDDGKFDLSTTGYSAVRMPGRAWPLPSPVRFYGFPDEAVAYFQNTAFVSDLALAVERLLRSVFYVGPLREHPKRLYLWSGEQPDHVGVTGSRAVEALLAAGDRAFNWKPKARTKTLEVVVAERLKSMGLIREFSVKPLREGGKEYEVLVKTSAKLPEVKLTDVGFGVGQVLPVIVECFCVPANSIVIFEQPEIHLHPRVQADLADLFVDAIRAREGGVLRNCQFIVETHSEHFLRRLQRRIAEEELASTDAAMYFVDTRSGTASIEALQVDPYGNISNWPENFFGDEMEDLIARSEAQAKRMAKEATK